MYSKIRPRRGSSTEWNLYNPVLLEGELGVEVPETGVGTGISKFKIGDGERHWSDLPYAFNATAASAIDGGTIDDFNLILLRSGPKDEWESKNPVLAADEIVFDTTQYAIKIGDGTKTFTELQYIGVIDLDNIDLDFGDLDA